MACKHAPKLARDYAGLYCVYCGERVATVEVDAGQLMLKKERAPRYVAVIHRGKQKAVKEVDEQGDTVLLRFGGDEEESVKTYHLLLAFQNPEEVLNV